MEENAELFVDPEEDEIFFYGVTEKEAQARNVLEDKMQLNAKKFSENCSDKNNYVPKPTENNFQTEGNMNPFKTSIGLEQITDLNWLSNSTNTNVTPLGRDSRNEENILEKCSTTLSYQESILSHGNGDYMKSPIKEAKPEIKKLDHSCGIAENKINISEDHNYSTPVRNVIDRSILKTPKSVVKADKDGGFLKVLSEIALVKAEADENTLGDTKIVAATSSSQELNDDNKENKKSDNERTNGIIKVDVSPGKSYVKKLSNEGQKKKIISSSPEKLNEHNIDFSIISELESIKLSEDVKGPFLENENTNLQGCCTKRVTDHPADKLCLVKCLPLHEDSPNKLVVLEKLNGNLFDDSVTKERKITEKFPMHDIEVKGNDKQDDSFAESITPKEIETFEETCAVKQNLSEKETRIIPVPELKLPEVVTEGKDSSCLPTKDFSDLERQKKFLRRNTMRLLEELNELVVSEQLRRESFGTTCNTMLSEDAAKVIQKLKAVGFDDSICSPDQYFDLDMLDNSVFSNELSDALNDTLSKPLSLITNKDVESLLEKINFLEDEGTVHPANKFDPKQENLFEARNGNFIDETEKSPSFRAEQIEGAAPDANNRPSDCAISVQCENKKVTESGFGNSLIQKLPGQPEVIQKGSKECRTIDRNIKSKGLTRIPKLTSTASKVPATRKQWKSTPSKTPLLKAVKSLKFNNIESPVSMYIKSKTTVMFPSGKSKIEIKDVACMKAENNTKLRKPEFRNILPKSEAKLTSHVVKLKNGTPLKLEKSPGSRIPRSVAKVPAAKLPTTAKNDDRIESSVLRRLDKQMRK